MVWYGMGCRHGRACLGSWVQRITYTSNDCYRRRCYCQSWFEHVSTACGELGTFSRSHQACLVTQVPIQKMPPSRPAPASSHMPSGTASQRPATAQSSEKPSKARKRAKQAAGAGTVLLALFSFVVFLGPLGPMAGPRLSGSAPALGHLHSAGFLPGSASMGGHLGGGRVLMAISSNSSDAQEAPPSLQHNQTALALPVEASLFLPDEALARVEDSEEGVVGDNFSGQGKVVSPGRWGGVLEAAHVTPLKSLVLRPSNKQAEVQALQGLKVTSVVPAVPAHARTWSMYCGNHLRLASA